jgi:hypothetical protein
VLLSYLTESGPSLNEVGPKRCCGTSFSETNRDPGSWCVPADFGAVDGLVALFTTVAATTAQHRAIRGPVEVSQVFRDGIRRVLASDPGLSHSALGPASRAVLPSARPV